MGTHLFQLLLLVGDISQCRRQVGGASNVFP